MVAAVSEPLTDIDRAGAIRICATAASTPGFLVDYGWSNIHGASERSWDVAFGAYVQALGTGRDAEVWAEAERLLRTGWAS